MFVLANNFYNNKGLNIGVSFKYIYQHLYNYNSSAYTFDIGVSKKYSKAGLGVVLKNLMSSEIDDYDLPMGIQTGVLYNFNLVQQKKTGDSLNMFIEAGLLYIPTIENFGFSIGTELMFYKNFHLRFGYSNGITFGLGIGFSRFQLDTGVLFNNDALSNNYKGTFSIKF